MYKLEPRKRFSLRISGQRRHAMTNEKKNGRCKKKKKEN